MGITCTIKINDNIKSDISRSLKYSGIRDIEKFVRVSINSKILDIIRPEKNTGAELLKVKYDAKKEVVFTSGEFPKTVIDRLNREYFYIFGEQVKIEKVTIKGKTLSYIKINLTSNINALASALKMRLRFANYRSKVFVDMTTKHKAPINDKTFKSIITTFNNASDEILNTFENIGRSITNNINILNKMKNDIMHSNKPQKEKNSIIENINKELSFLNKVKSKDFYGILLHLEAVGNSPDKRDEYNTLINILLNTTENILYRENISDSSLYISKLILDNISHILQKDEIRQLLKRDDYTRKIVLVNDLINKFEKKLNSFVIDKLNQNEHFVNLYNNGKKIPETVDLKDYINQKIKENDLRFLDFLNDISAVVAKFYSQGDTFDHNNPLAQLALGLLEKNVNNTITEYSNLFYEVKQLYIKALNTLKRLGLTDKVFYRVSEGLYTKELVSRYSESNTIAIMVLNKLSEKIMDTMSSSTNKELENMVEQMHRIFYENEDIHMLHIEAIPELSQEYKLLTGKTQDTEKASLYRDKLIRSLGEKHYNELVQEQRNKINGLPIDDKNKIDLNKDINRYSLGIFYSTNINPIYTSITENDDLYELYSKIKYILEKTYDDAPIDVKITGHNHAFLHIPSTFSFDKKNFIVSVLHALKDTFKDIRNTIFIHAKDVNRTIDANKVSSTGLAYNSVVIKGIRESEFHFVRDLSFTDMYKCREEVLVDTLISELNPDLVDLLASRIGMTPNDMHEKRIYTVNDYTTYYALYKISEDITFDLMTSLYFHTSKMAEYIGRYNSLSTVKLFQQSIENLDDNNNLKNIKAQFTSWFNQSVLNKLDEESITQIKRKLMKITGKTNEDILLDTYSVMVAEKFSKGMIYTKEQKIILRELKKMINDFIEKTGIPKEDIIQSIYNKVNNGDTLTEEEEKILNLAEAVSSFIRINTHVSLVYGILHYLRVAALAYRLKSQTINVIEGIISEIFNSYDDYDKIMLSHEAISVALGMVANKVPGLKNMSSESTKLYNYMNISSITQSASNIISRAGVQERTFASKASEGFYGYHVGEMINQSITVYKILNKYGVGSKENGDFISIWDLMDENCELKKEYDNKDFKYYEEAKSLMLSSNSDAQHKLRLYILGDIMNNHGNYSDTRRTISNEKLAYKAFEFLRRWMSSYVSNFFSKKRVNILEGKIKKGIIHQPTSVLAAFQLGTSFLYFANPITAILFATFNLASNKLFSLMMHQKTSLDIKSSLKAFFQLYLNSAKMVINDLTLHKIDPLKRSIANSFNEYARENSNYTNVDAGNSRKMARYLALLLEFNLLQATLVALSKAIDDDDDDDDVPLSFGINLLANLEQQIYTFTNPLSLINNLLGFGLYNDLVSLQENTIKFITNFYKGEKQVRKNLKSVSNLLPEPFKSIMQSVTEEGVLPLLGFQIFMKEPNKYAKERTGYQLGNIIYKTDKEKIVDEKKEAKEEIEEMLKSGRFKDFSEKDITNVVNKIYTVDVISQFKSGCVMSLNTRLKSVSERRKEELYRQWTGKKEYNEDDYMDIVNEQINKFKELDPENTMQIVKFFLALDNAIGGSGKYLEKSEKNMDKISEVHKWVENPDKYLKEYLYNEEDSSKEITMLKMIKELENRGNVSEMILEQYKSFDKELNKLKDAISKAKVKEEEEIIE